MNSIVIPLLTQQSRPQEAQKTQKRVTRWALPNFMWVGAGSGTTSRASLEEQATQTGSTTKYTKHTKNVPPPQPPFVPFRGSSWYRRIGFHSSCFRRSEEPTMDSRVCGNDKHRLLLDVLLSYALCPTAYRLPPVTPTPYSPFPTPCPSQADTPAPRGPRADSDRNTPRAGPRSRTVPPGR